MTQTDETHRLLPTESSILVVDDLPSARRIVVRLLRTLGYENITEASNRKEALAKAESAAPRLIISDLHLKDELGTDLVKDVRGLPGAAGLVPCIIITSDMDKDSFHAALQSGVTSYLLKPFSADALSEKIVFTIRKSEASG